MENYFISERTGEKIFAPLNNSLIWRTARPQDLVPVFMDALRETCAYERFMNEHPSLKDAFDNERHEFWESEECAYFLNEDLFDELDMHSPDGYYFGSAEGDGSDFGFWSIDENEDY